MNFTLAVRARSRKRKSGCDRNLCRGRMTNHSENARRSASLAPVQKVQDASWQTPVTSGCARTRRRRGGDYTGVVRGSSLRPALLSVVRKPDFPSTYNVAADFHAPKPVLRGAKIAQLLAVAGEGIVDVGNQDASKQGTHL
jgi:hypothetical protein